MKNRNLFTNILSILILIALVFFLLIQFGVITAIDGTLKSVLVFVTLGIAVLSVIFIDIVFPIIDNKHRLAEKKYLILFIIKLVLFIAAIVVLLLLQPFQVIQSATVALVCFIVLYFAQFFINLDSKPSDDDEEEDVDYEELDEDEYDDTSDFDAEESDEDDSIESEIEEYSDASEQISEN